MFRARYIVTEEDLLIDFLIEETSLLILELPKMVEMTNLQFLLDFFIDKKMVYF